MEHLRTHVRKIMSILAYDLKDIFTILLKYEAKFILDRLDKLIELYEPDISYVRQFSEHIHPMELYSLENQFDECIETLNQIVENENQKHLI